MTQTLVAAKAYRHLLAEQDRLGSNCVDRPMEFSGDEPVSSERAAQLCAGCPLAGLGEACHAYAAVATSLYGVFDRRWYDTHGDVEVGWDEEVEMVKALGEDDAAQVTEGADE